MSSRSTSGSKDASPRPSRLETLTARFAAAAGATMARDGSSAQNNRGGMALPVEEVPGEGPFIQAFGVECDQRPHPRLGRFEQRLVAVNDMEL